MAGFLIQVVVFVSCYFVMLYFWGMNEKEKQDVQHMLKRGKNETEEQSWMYWVWIM